MSFYCDPLFGLHFMHIYKQSKFYFSLSAIMWCIFYDAPCTVIMVTIPNILEMTRSLKHVILDYNTDYAALAKIAL